MSMEVMSQKAIEGQASSNFANTELEIPGRREGYVAQATCNKWLAYLRPQVAGSFLAEELHDFVGV